jgi:hypothetical protein
MPTLCASFPIAPELSQVDFWHVRRVFWRKSRPVSAPLSLGHSSLNDKQEMRQQRMASGWQSEEHYVILRNHNCEGFEVSGGEVDETVCSSNQTEQQHLSAPLSTIKSFLTSPSEDETLEEGDSTIERWEESQWFFALVEDISDFFPVDLIRFKSVQVTFVNRLALIWYNFDSLSSSASRPIKSYRRLKKDIEALTWTLVKETKRFVESVQGEGQEEERLSQSYHDLLVRWKIN